MSSRDAELLGVGGNAPLDVDGGTATEWAALMRRRHGLSPTRFVVVACAPEDFAWFRERSTASLAGDAKAIKAVDAGGRVRGMVVLERFRPASAEVHVVAETPAAWRALLPAAADWAFRQCGLSVVFGQVPASKAPSWRFATRVGFRHVARLADGFEVGDDLHLFELRRADAARWLSKEAP